MNYTSYTEIRRLRTRLVKLYKALMLDCQEMETNTRQLQQSFLDDGIDEVNACNDAMIRMIKEKKEALVTVADALQRAADLLEAGKKVGM